MSEYPKGYEWLEDGESVCMYKGSLFFIRDGPYEGRSPTDPSKDIFWIIIQRKRGARIFSVPLSEVFPTPRTIAAYERKQAEIRATLSLSVDRALAEEVVADINTALALAEKHNMINNNNKVFHKYLPELKKLLMEKLTEN